MVESGPLQLLTKKGLGAGHLLSAQITHILFQAVLPQNAHICCHVHRSVPTCQPLGPPSMVASSCSHPSPADPLGGSTGSMNHLLLSTFSEPMANICISGCIIFLVLQCLSFQRYTHWLLEHTIFSYLPAYAHEFFF